MKKHLPISLLFMLIIIVTPVMSQKVTVSLNRSRESSLSFWRILDENAKEVFSARGHLNEDTVTFSLEAERLFSLWIAVQDTNIHSPINYTLSVNGNDILRINGKSPECEHEYKFFTGIRAPVSKIIGGTNASIVNNPWQVYYISGNYRCGASIIAPGWVITAAHCTEDSNHNPIPAENMSVIAGADNPTTPNNPGKKYLISEVIRHEGYNNYTFDNDIALLKLNMSIYNPNSTPIKLVSNIDVSEGATVPGVMSRVTGWGLVTYYPPTPAAILQEAQLPIVANELALTVFASIPSTNLIAGYPKGNQDACSGDSGGPLTVPVLGEYKLAGIVSWGSTVCDTYSGFTKISTFLDWIEEKTGIIDFRPAIPSGNNVICNTSDTAVYNVDPYPSGINYQWKLYPDGTGTIKGNLTSAKVIWNKSYSGQVFVMVRTNVNGVYSDWSKQKVLIAPKINIKANPTDTEICTNQPLTLSTFADGYNLSYKWYRNNSLVKSGSSNYIHFDSVKSVNSGIYRCDITDGCGFKSSSANSTLTVQPLTAVTRLNNIYDASIGDNPTLQINTEGLNLSYQWQKDGIIITDGTYKYLPLFDVNTKDIGQYRVIVSGTCGTVISDSIYVFVKNKATSGSEDAFVWPTIASDEFNIAVNNDDSYTIQLFDMRGSFIKELKNCRYQTSLYAGSLGRGSYILKIFSTNFRKTVRVIKQ